MISSIKFKEFVGKQRGSRMLQAMSYHSPIKKKLKMAIIPRSDVKHSEGALQLITFFDLDDAISHYKARISNERYKHLVETSKRYYSTLSEFKEWLNESK